MSMKLATAVTEAVIRTLYNEGRAQLVCAAYGYDFREPPSGSVPYINEKIEETEQAKGGWVRWLGSLDAQSLERLTEFCVRREVDQLRKAIRDAEGDAMLHYAERLTQLEVFTR